MGVPAFAVLVLLLLPEPLAKWLPDFAMPNPRDVVVTGVGAISPLGIGNDALWQNLESGASGVSVLPEFVDTGLPFRFGGIVQGFEGKDFVQPRKTLKVMSREIQIGFSSAVLAMRSAGLEKGNIDPERLGVVMGSELLYGELEELREAFIAASPNHEFQWPLWADSAMKNLFPLWMLKYLPNMAACHIGIAHDARGPNNSIVQGDVSSLLAIAESASVIRRGHADVVITGGSGSYVAYAAIAFRGWQHLTASTGDGQVVPRVFDKRHDGFVLGEGAGALVLESREHAEKRGAKILAEVAGTSSRFQKPLPYGDTTSPLPSHGISGSIEGALKAANLQPSQIGHVAAGSSGIALVDRAEAQGIAKVLGDVPVTAYKSRFGHLGAGSSAVEAVATVLALQKGIVPVTRNCEEVDPACPINVVKEKQGPLSGRPASALVLSQSQTGQCAAVALIGPEA